MARYTFGDGDLAAERLHVLDDAFADTADALLAELAVSPTRVADLGCGPGATTARLHAVFPHAAVVGVDASPVFVAQARRALPVATFVVADATRPLPHGPFDLVYARFLLAHLPDVAGALHTWVRALHPGGLLVLEETEHLTSTDADFARYEAVSRARVGAQGALLYAGGAIAAVLPFAAVEVVIDRVVPLDLTAGQAAAMFWRNLATWGSDAVADGLLGEDDRSALLDRLAARVEDPTRGLFTWTHRQTVLRRS